MFMNSLKKYRLMGVFDSDKRDIFNQLTKLFGAPTVSEEVSIYFKDTKNIRIKINPEGLFYTDKKKGRTIPSPET